MSAIEWLSAIGAAGAMLALLVCVVNLRLLRRSDPGAAPRADLRVSICIPARDEEENIEACVRAALASDHASLEVLVYDDESSDGTRRIVERLAREDARCRLAPGRPLPPGWNGKQHACAAMAEAARGEWLLFTDADVRLGPDTVRRGLDFALRSHSSLVSTFPRQRTATLGELLLVPMMFFLLLSYLPFALMRRSRMASASAGCGQFLLAERVAYRDSGGHAGFRDACHDGVRLPRAFRRRGHRTDLFDGTDVAAVRMYRGFAGAWRGFSKDAYEGVGSFAGLVAMSGLHLVAHVLPWILLPVLALGGASPLAIGASATAVGAGALERVLLARRFGHSLWLALLHPLSVLLMTAVQWRSAWLSLTGGLRWRGRSARGHREEVVLVDAEDRELGTREKLEAHRSPGALHRAFSVFVFDARGRTLLQQRAPGKYHFGGLWTNSCCGHPRPGEALVEAATRRLREEMGIAVQLERVGSFVYSAHDSRSGLTEHELDHVLVGRFEGTPAPDPGEAADWRWVAPEELESELARTPNAFTPWLPLAWAALVRARPLPPSEAADGRLQPALDR